MTESQILTELNAIFRDVFNDDSLTLTPATTAADVPGWDSLTHVTLTVSVEAHFGIKFRAAELEELHNIGDFVHAIARKKG